MEDSCWPKREGCQCLAKVHEFVGNCLNCGLIICQADRAEKCRFCDASLSHLESCTKSQREKKLQPIVYNSIEKKNSVVIDENIDGSLFFDRTWLSKQEQELVEKQVKDKQEERRAKVRELKFGVEIVDGCVVYKSRTSINQ